MNPLIQQLTPLCSVITPEGDEGTLLGLSGTREEVQEIVKTGDESELMAVIQVYKQGKRGKVVFFPIKSLKKVGITT